MERNIEVHLGNWTPTYEEIEINSMLAKDNEPDCYYWKLLFGKYGNKVQTPYEYQQEQKVLNLFYNVQEMNLEAAV